MSSTIVGERFYIYACKAKAKRPIWSDDPADRSPRKGRTFVELNCAAIPAGLLESGACEAGQVRFSTPPLSRST